MRGTCRDDGLGGHSSSHLLHVSSVGGREQVLKTSLGRISAHERMIFDDFRALGRFVLPHAVFWGLDVIAPRNCDGFAGS